MILRSNVRVIRKPQRCWGCGLRFPIGTHMHYVVAVDEFTYGYWCPTCASVADGVMPDDGIGEGEVRTEMFDEWKKELVG